MKRLGRVLGNLLAVILAVCSLQAMAAGSQMAGRDFDHTATGFPLTGVHALTACETCHVAGVFKGTPKVCDGCHALGKRVVATPKSTSHIVTDAPCETCHFNSSTFLGARFNHATALPEQCRTCHNGRIATGKPASHYIGKKATDSCDHCHRSYAFLPASWNHNGVTPGTCENAGCHVIGSNQYNRSSAITRLGKPHTSFTYTNSQSCDVCHNFVTWLSTRHMPLSGTCSSCHNNAGAEGWPTTHSSFSGWGNPTECSECHTSITIWTGALGAKPSNHIPYNAAPCTNCHLGTTVATGNTLHANVSPPCTTCHLSSNPVYYWPNHAPSRKSSSHLNGKADCISCHSPSYTKWDNP